MFVDVTLNHVRTKSRATNLIKYIFVIISTAVTLPVFANDKHADIMDKIISELYSKKPVIDECYAKIDTGDIKSALTLCRQAAEQGDAGAQFYLGVMFNIGKGKLKDDKQAVYWFTKAAEQGNAVAQTNIGLMIYNGQGTLKDDKQAVYWFTKAAEQGNAVAQTNIGLMIYNGQGTLKDDKQAVYWFTKAAEQGNAVAQFNLGFMFSGGLGTPKDNVMAYVWWNIAAAQGHEYSSKNRSVVEKKMTLNQIADAQKLSKEYYAKYVK
jgi:TPR repeat protein